MKKVIVTGGAGFVGAHTAKILAARGFEPIVFDSLENGFQKNVKWGPFFKGNLLDPESLKECFSKYQPAAVFHFAAYALVGESVENPERYTNNNVTGTLNLLHAMKDAGCSKIVFSSSCAVYGYPLNIPISEEESLKPVNPYGKSKMMAEQLLKDFDESHRIHSVSLRYFNASGCDPDGEIGEEHQPESHLIPLALKSVFGGTAPFIINGDDYDTPDGTCIRDYVHVTDLANAHVLALSYLEGNGPTECFNLGSGIGFSVKEVIHAVEEVTGKEIPFKIGERRKGDPPRLIAQSDKAKKQLNWIPEFKDLKKQIEHVWMWMQKH